MAYTYSKISSVTVGSGGSSSIDFIAIPQNYTDLLLVTSTRGNNADNAIYLQFNASTTNLSNRRLYTNASTVASYNSSDIVLFTNRSSSGTTSTFDNTQIYIPNYTSSNYKSVSIDNATERNDTNNDLMLAAGLWSNSSAINAIKLVPSAGSFVQYSTATLYGIKAEV